MSTYVDSTMQNAEATTAAAPIMNFMVVAGYRSGGATGSAELIDSETMSLCPNQPVNFPFSIYSGTSFKHGSKPVICGNDCYSYSYDGWQREDFRFVPARYSSMSVEIRPEEWLIMGGLGGSNRLTDTKYFRNGTFIDGPEMPEAIRGGSAVLLNETHVFVAAADHYPGSTYSLKNYLLDIDTEEWTRIADRQSTGIFHASGTFYNSTAEEVQVANINNYNMEVYSPREDSWRRISWPSGIGRMYYSKAIQQGFESFVLIGGATDTNNYSGDVYLFDENGLSVIAENVLTIGRHDHAVLPIATDDFICG